MMSWAMTMWGQGFDFMRLFNNVNAFFLDSDTTYSVRQPYWFTAQTELSYWHDFYRISSSETQNSMTIQSEPSLVAGGYLYFSILGYGLSYNLNDIGKTDGEMNGTSIRQSLVLNTNKFFGEYYTFNSGKMARITRVGELEMPRDGYAFKGLSSRCNGLSAMYIFNNRKYSWPAAFESSAIQKKSCGTWSIGFQYNHQNVKFNDEELPNELVGKIDSTLLFNEVNYYDYSVNFGYSYNWVLKRNCLFAISLLPSLGYRRSNITEAMLNHSILNNMSTDLNIHSSLTWNNNKYFTSLRLDLHTYSYRRDKFGLTNTYGTLKFVAGCNFLGKK